MAFKALEDKIQSILKRLGAVEARPVMPTGSVSAFAGATAPAGWLFCDGSAVSREEHSDLFGVIGTTYGTGDGSTTFNLPNLSGRVPVGVDSTQEEFEDLGQTGGEKTHTLTTDEIPSHTHSMYYNTAPGGSAYSSFSLLQNVQSPHSTVGWGAGAPFSPNRAIGINATGGGQEHNNLQPYLVLQFVIKA